MESDKLNELFENKHFLLNKEIDSLLSKLFEESLCMFKGYVVYNEGAFFKKYFIYDSIEIEFVHERTSLEYSLKILGKVINLLEYDNRIVAAEVASEKNILFVFNVMKRYLEEQNYLSR
jgi:hypothetical protein